MPNKLIHEPSLYLQQHAHNPVNWYPWGEEAFTIAKNENKPVIISIGYAACHWCHVMERESFEDEDTAAYMNTHFINIKVDREEHPDVDQMYMDAVQAIGGNGGWPLNVFATHDKIPFYGGTYFPPRPAFNRPSWMQLLQRMHEIWITRPDEIKMQTEQMNHFLKNLSLSGAKPALQEWEKNVSDQMANNLLQHADKVNGGFGNAPKFPQSMSLLYLLEYYHFSGNKKALQHALLSLDKMMRGGIYDQLGGGFARYSTDAEWLAPHFEKMLYDNALLIPLYSAAYRIVKDESYKNIVQETIVFAERELRDVSGLYYCALDADSEGEEGKYYTWTFDEIQSLLSEKELQMATEYFGIKPEGNWEQTNILNVAKTIAEIADEKKINQEDIAQIIANVKGKLFSERAKKIRPQTDDKCLLSWNALMNIALIEASKLPDGNDYLKIAENHMNTMLACFQNQKGLYHFWKEGNARVQANLEDFATLIQALIRLAEVTGNTEHLLKASSLLEIVLEEFSHENAILFYYTSKYSDNIPVRKVDLYDGALPSSNAMMCGNLLALGLYMGNHAWLERAELMLQQVYHALSKHTLSFSFWACLLQRKIAGIKSIIVAEETNILYEEILKQFLPHGFIFHLQKNTVEIPLLEHKFLSGEKHIFVCTQEACYTPVGNVHEALQLL